MNMRKITRIALEMLEEAVLSALDEARQWGPSGRGQTLLPSNISRKIGIVPTVENNVSYYDMVRGTLLRLETKNYVERWSENTQRWRITEAGVSFLAED